MAGEMVSEAHWDNLIDQRRRCGKVPASQTNRSAVSMNDFLFPSVRLYPTRLTIIGTVQASIKPTIANLFYIASRVS